MTPSLDASGDRSGDDPHGPVDPSVYEIASAAEGPSGTLPLTDGMLRGAPSGDLFGLSQNVGMGWPAAGSEIGRAHV